MPDRDGFICLSAQALSPLRFYRDEGPVDLSAGLLVSDTTIINRLDDRAERRTDNARHKCIEANPTATWVVNGAASAKTAFGASDVRVPLLLRMLEIPQIGRRLILLGGNQQIAAADDIVIADEDARRAIAIEPNRIVVSTSGMTWPKKEGWRRVLTSEKAAPVRTVQAQIHYSEGLEPASLAFTLSTKRQGSNLMFANQVIWE
jgi:hypothetical protein